MFKKIFSNFYLSALVVFLSGLISVYDNVMNVIFFKTLKMDERNPIASWIIETKGVSGLVEIKAVTTVIAVAIMLGLLKTRYKIIIWPIFFFQLCLFYYLTFHIADGTGDMFGKDFGLPVKLFFEFYMGEHKP